MEQQSRNRQPVRSGGRRKRRKVRYDRIFIALAIVVIILVLMGSCTCSCVQCVCAPSESTANKNKDNKDKDKDKETQEDETTPSVTAPAQNAVSLTLTPDDVNKGTLVVVNETQEYKFPAEDVKLVSVYEKRNASYSVSDMDIQLDEEAVAQLNVMLSEFSTIYGNSDIQVASGYRSKQDQQGRYTSGSSIFPGGYSDYHTGRSFDLCIAPESGMSSYYVASGDYSWITEHAADFGFVIRYPDGKIDATGVNPRAYTFHYVGLPHSAYMSEKSLCLEEYVEEIKEYPATAPLGVKAGDTTWTVFYVEQSPNGSTVVNVPGCQEYSVSGNNIDGFIVAYH